MAADSPVPAGAAGGSLSPAVDELDATLLRLAHQLPLCRDPFGELARQAGCGREEALARLRALGAAGALKRIGAVLRHQRAGYAAGGMLVCRLPLDWIAAAGEQLAARAEVSHCYRRKAYPDWPYNLYAMIHGHCETEVRSVADGFRRDWEDRLEAFDLLFSIAEWKKTSFSL